MHFCIALIKYFPLTEQRNIIICTCAVVMDYNTRTCYHEQQTRGESLFMARGNCGSPTVLARMHVKHFIKPPSVEVTYISTHTNHTVGIQECKHLPLPLSVRRDIQERFSGGVTLERIMSGKYIKVHLKRFYSRTI